MLMDIDIIMRVFIKNSHTICLQIGEEQTQLKVLMQVLCEFSPFFSFSPNEEL